MWIGNDSYASVLEKLSSEAGSRSPNPLGDRSPSGRDPRVMSPRRGDSLTWAIREMPAQGRFSFPVISHCYPFHPTL